ncbi:MAG: hypothetical protein Q7S83_01120 [bacterium]|nr:hypothetical protein [bacterium]
MALPLSKIQKRKYYRRLRLKLYCYAGLLTFLGLGILYTLLNFDFFRIKKFDVSGSADFEEIRGELLNGDLARFLGFGNFLSWPSTVSGFKVEKDFLTGTLRIVARAADRFAIWCSNDCYWISRGGQLIEKAPDTEGSAIPKIVDAAGKIVRIGDSVMAVDAFENVQRIMAGLNGLVLGVSEYRFDARLQELTAFGVRGEKLIFSVRFLPSLKIFSYLQDLMLSGKLRTSEYVDFTVENRIYLKSR